MFTEAGVFVGSFAPELDKVFVTPTGNQTKLRDTGVSINDFHTISATVYGEGPSKNRTTSESTGIANVIKNQANKRNETIVQSATSSRFFGKDNKAAVDYQKNWRQGGASEAPAARSGAIAALLGMADNTNGSTMFEGISVLASPKFQKFQAEFIDTGVAYDPITIGETNFYKERTADEAAKLMN